MYKTKVSDSHLVHEKRWTADANECLLELLEERRYELFGPESEMTPHKRMEMWEEIAVRMREQGFTQTTASCNKKYCNMRRTYMSNKKKNAKLRVSNPSASVKPGEKVGRNVGWPYYDRLGKLLKLSGTMESDDDGVVEGQQYYDEGDSGSNEDEDEGEPSAAPGPGAAVNKAIRNLLETNLDPVLILEDINPPARSTAKTEVENQEYQDDEVEVATGSDFVSDEITEPSGDHEWKPSSSSNLSAKRISARNILRKSNAAKRTSSFTPTFSSKKPRIEIRNGTDRMQSTNSRKAGAGEADSTDAMIVEEVQALRQEVRGINRNLEKLVDVHIHLNDNFERFLTSLRLRH